MDEIEYLLSSADKALEDLEKWLNQHTTVDELFSIRWSVT